MAPRVVFHAAASASFQGNYGTPPPGSHTEARGHAAHEQIGAEIVQLCEVMEEHAISSEITFGELFDIYSSISNKVVGVLLRARKYGIVSFEGEMLFQNRDKLTMIRLLRSSAEVSRSTSATAPLVWGSSLQPSLVADSLAMTTQGMSATDTGVSTDPPLDRIGQAEYPIAAV